MPHAFPVGSNQRSYQYWSYIMNHHIISFTARGNTFDYVVETQWIDLLPRNSFLLQKLLTFYFYFNLKLLYLVPRTLSCSYMTHLPDYTQLLWGGSKLSQCFDYLGYFNFVPEGKLGQSASDGLRCKTQSYGAVGGCVFHNVVKASI